MNQPDVIIEKFSNWAQRTRSVEAALLFGSRSRAETNISKGDIYSDVDFQVVTHRPDFFSRSEWTSVIGVSRNLAFVHRSASGGVSRATVLLSSCIEVDVVVIPAMRMQLARVALLLGVHKRSDRFARSLDELATVLGGGYKIIKGGVGWDRFYSAVVREVRGARILDEDVLRIADEFVCDYHWCIQKIHRGELIAAQRMLYRSLLEINFRLQHEARIRKSMPSYREARRVEFLLDSNDIEMISVEVRLTGDSIRKAAKKCALVLQGLVRGLVGERWSWPSEIPV